MEKVKLVRWPRLVIGSVTLMFAGIIYAWSILKAPFEGIWDSGQLGFNYTVTIIFFCLGGLLSGFITKKTSSGFRLAVSGLLIFAGFFITSRLDGGSVVPLYLSYGVLAGTGVGFSYNTVLGVTNAWFPDKKGMSAGVLLMGFGLNSLIIGRLADSMGRSASIGWEKTYLILAIACGAVILLASLFIKPPPDGTLFPEPKAAKKAQPSGGEGDYAGLKMVKRPSFIKLFIFITLLSSAGSAANSFARDIVMDVGASAGFAVTLVGIMAVSNAFGRFVVGWLFDGIGRRRTQYVVGAAGVAAPLMIMLSFLTGSLAFGAVGVCLCGFTYGAGSTTASVFVMTFFGQKNYALNFSIFNLVLIISPFAATMAGRLKDSTGSFLTPFIILTVLGLVGLAADLSIKKA